MQMLTVHDWDTHQSYRSDRGQPPWIKIHRAIIRHHKWAKLSDAERGQLVAIWILAADQDGRIPADARLVRKLCYMDDDPNLERFVALGFLDDDVKALDSWRHDDATVTPTRRQGDAPEERREEEKKNIRVKRSPVYTEGFLKVWAIHNKGPKPKAMEAYARALELTDHDTIVDSLRAYVAKFTSTWTGAHLHRWLEGERWEEGARESPQDLNERMEFQRRLIYDG